MRRLWLINIILILLSVFLTRLAFPPFNFYLLAFVGLIPFFYVICKTEKYMLTLVYGQIFGFLFYLSFFDILLVLSNYVSFWLVLGLGLILLFIQGLFISAAVLVGKFVQKNTVLSGFPKLIITALAYAFAWIILDWLRSLWISGLTISGLAYSQYLFVSFIQLAKYIGPYGLTFIIVFLNIAGSLFLTRIARSKKREKYNWLIFALALTAGLALIFYFVELNINYPKTTEYEHKLVTVFQPNIPQNEKLTADTELLEKIYLSEIRAFSQEHKTELLIMPETIIAEYLLNNRNFMFALRDALDFSLIFGTPRYEERKGFRYIYNSVVLFNRHGNLTILHDKKYLVPFGEYLPMRRVFMRFFKGTGYFDSFYTRGQKNESVANYSVALCFESFFPYQAREQIRSGGRLLLVITNDAWFGNTPLLDMHLSYAVLRAVENSRYVVQAANTGRSAIIDHKGRILKQSQIDAREWLTETVELRTDKTPYTYFGELVIYVGLVFFSLYAYLFLFFRHKKN